MPWFYQQTEEKKKFLWSNKVGKPAVSPSLEPRASSGFSGVLKFRITDICAQFPMTVNSTVFISEHICQIVVKIQVIGVPQIFFESNCIAIA